MTGAWVGTMVLPHDSKPPHTAAETRRAELLKGVRRVIVKLGDLPSVSPRTIERLYAADLAYLQDLYRRINEIGHNVIQTTCPACGHTYEAEVVPLGG